VSTVLWANSLANGEVTSDESDKVALHRHADKLDQLSAQLKLRPFSELLDATDVKYNVSDLELPEGCSSTNDVMAKEGVWVDAAEALRRLQQLLAHIQQHKTRFGLLRNDHAAVVGELEESIAFVARAATANEKVNFSIVM